MSVIAAQSSPGLAGILVFGLWMRGCGIVVFGVAMILGGLVKA